MNQGQDREIESESTRSCPASMEPPKGNAIVLVGLSLLSLAIGYGTSIFVARTLGPRGFEEYVFAIASLSILTTISEAGTGKFALQILPVYQSAEQWRSLRGYWRFSLRLICLFSLAIAAMVLWVGGLSEAGFPSNPLSIAVLFLPAAALSGVGVDFVMANRAAIQGAMIARAVIPATTLALMVFTANCFPVFDVIAAVICYGVGACVGAVLAICAFWKTAPRSMFTQSPETRSWQWLSECMHFLVLSSLITWMFRISVVVLELLPIDGVEVAYFAAALESGSLILMISKSTDKFFQPYLALTVEKKSWREWNQMYRHRFLWVGGTCLCFMVGMILFGKSLLRLYGEPFENGYDALCLISVATCIWTLYSLSPFYLKYSGQTRLVLAILIAGALLMATLTAVLGLYYGASGAALAFSVSLLCVVGTFYFSARRRIVITSRSEST